MSKSRGRFLSELLNSTGFVKRSRSDLAGADGTIDLDSLPTIPNSQLEHSSVSIAGHTLSLGGSLTLNTADIGEHASYLYYTDARARSAVSVSGDLAYNSTTGVLSYTTPTTIASLSNHDSDDLSEGLTNLYYTSARVNTDFDTRLATKSTTNLSEGTNLYYTDARVGSYLTANSYATQGYVSTAISNLVDTAPSTLDTLNELAAALGDDANFSTTVTNSIATKWTQDNTKISNWDTAYSWGNHASAGYLTGNQTITLTGDVSGSGTTSIAVTIADDSHNHVWGNIDGASVGGLVGPRFTTPSGYIEFGPANTTWAHIYTDRPNFYFNKNLYVLDNIVWTSANDGSGSGLDADTLDGVQGSGYQSRLLQQSSRNLVLATGTTGSGGLFLESSSGQFIFQLYGTQSQYGFLGSEWGAWDIKKIPGGNMMLSNSDSNIVWHAGNDGSGSGLDADLLDGLQLHTGRNNEANKVVRTDGSGYIQAGWINSTSGASPTATRLTRITSSHDAYLRYMDPASFKVQIGESYKNTYSRSVDYTTDVNYWVGSFGHSGYGANETFHGGSGFFDIWSGTNYPSGFSHIHGFNAVHYTTNSLGTTGGNAYGWQMATQYNSDAGPYFRRCSTGTFSAWRKIWHDGNDGSGSGLDADTVDGVQASTIAQLNVSQTFASNTIKYFQVDRGGYSGSLTTGNLQAYSANGNSAFMSFHRGAYYAVNMGLDADNVLRIGGWSASANRWALDMSGNMTAAGNVTAYSDIRLKENINVISDALEKVQKIRGVTFTRNDQEDKEKLHTGVIAQEVEAVLPEVISEDNLGIKNVAYGNMVGLLIEAIKELKAEVDDLKTQLEKK